jgi:Spy/CpxP family protein refolding chaperone
MKTQRRNLLLVALTLLLFLIAAVQVWPAIANWHNRSQVEHRVALGSPHGPMAHKNFHGKGGPLAELGLSDAQQKQLDAIMQETIQQERAKVRIPAGAKKEIRIPIPMERIRAILTPEQRLKLDEMEKRMRDHFSSPGRHDATLPSPNNTQTPGFSLHKDG